MTIPLFRWESCDDSGWNSRTEKVQVGLEVSDAFAAIDGSECTPDAINAWTRRCPAAAARWIGQRGVTSVNVFADEADRSIAHQDLNATGVKAGRIPDSVAGIAVVVRHAIDFVGTEDCCESGENGIPISPAKPTPLSWRRNRSGWSIRR